MKGGLLKQNSRGVWQQRYFTVRGSPGALSVVYSKRRGGDASAGVELVSPEAAIEIETFHGHDGFEHDELKLTGPDTTSRAQSTGGRRKLRTLRLRYNFAVPRVEDSVRSWYEFLRTAQQQVRANLGTVVVRHEVPAARDWLVSHARRPQYAWFHDGIDVAVNPKALARNTRYCLHLTTPHLDDPTTWALHLQHPREMEVFVRLDHIRGAPSVAKGARRIVTLKEAQPGATARGLTPDVESNHRYSFESTDDAANFAIALGSLLDFLDRWREVDSAVKQSGAEHYDVLSAREVALRSASAGAPEDAPEGAPADALAESGPVSLSKPPVKRRVTFSNLSATDAPNAPNPPAVLSATSTHVRDLIYR